MNNIFFDFDGTLVNSQVRLYNLFCSLCPECEFSYEEYWDIKRNHITQYDFLKDYCHYDDAKIESFRKKWFESVEDDTRMSEDFLVEGMLDVIEKLFKKYNLYLITHRQKEELVIQELTTFGINNFFKRILVTKQKISKSELIKQHVSVSANDFVIGDTGEDIKTAQELGIKSIATTWGVMNKSVLEKYKPDLIVDTVDAFYKTGIL